VTLKCGFVSESTVPESTVNDQIVALAHDAGFSTAGIAPVPLPGEPADDPELSQFEPYFEGWIERGYAGEMEYLKRRDQDNRLLRSSLRIAVPWARSVIVCAANYNADAPKSIDPASPESAWIARYALTGHQPGEAQGTSRPSDYHDVLLARLKNLEQSLQQSLGPFQARCYVDTGPLVERAYARYAGIGWTGKNTCIINQELGSWLFLGVILTGLELPPATLFALPEDRCGSCTRCIDACPTGALVAPYQMDASLCIAYLTIEKRGPIPEPLRPQMGRQVFGCDICQDVCPWNRRAPVSADPELAARRELVNPALAWLAELDAESFRSLFRQSPVQRAKLNGLLRNVAIAMGNSGLASYRAKLQEWAAGTDPVLAEAARWALARLSTTETNAQAQL
jgi:epoxyqueuosine reductase